MEKYFKIEIRLAQGAREVKNGRYQLVDKFYYGDGYLRIKDDEISGVIALDYIEGKIGEETVEICLHAEETEWEMAISKEDFYLPQNFLMLYENVAIELSVGEAINNLQKQKLIREEIEDAREYQMQ